jgi:serine-type D-Ala-D-Ala carboxypeptidase/endopeptidase (penicillin-binding protein 4)
MKLSRDVLVPLVTAALGVGVALAPAASNGLLDRGDQPAAATASGLGSQLDKILADPRLSGAQVGLEVRDAKTGDVLYDHDAGERLLPASNAKLATSTAAMEILGSDHRFTTSVLSSGENLYLRGTGDPTMLGTDYDALAKSVADSGVKVVRGRLVADDTYFDDVRLAPFWSWDDEPFYYDGQVSALSVAPDTDYDAGSVIVNIAPGAKAGDPAKVTVTPPNHYFHIINNATTGSAGSSDTSNAVRRHGENVVDVTGSIPVGSSADEVWVTAWDPTGLVASLFTDALQRHGVRVIGGQARGATPSGARTVASHQSMTLGEMLTPFLKLSNNMHAEHLAKTMGREVNGAGTWSAGTAAITAEMKQLGLDTSQLRMVDGSGLSRADLISPHQITTLLLAVQDKPWFQTWYNALPIAGNPDRMTGGTLRNRMRGTPAANNMHAKTGSMTSVSALSGYVTAASGEKLVFSMISNDFLSSSMTSVEDQVGVTLASYDGSGTADLARAPAARQEPNAMQRRHPTLECSWTKSC